MYVVLLARGVTPCKHVVHEDNTTSYTTCTSATGASSTRSASPTTARAATMPRHRAVGGAKTGRQLYCTIRLPTYYVSNLASGFSSRTQATTVPASGGCQERWRSWFCVPSRDVPPPRNTSLKNHKDRRDLFLASSNGVRRWERDVGWKYVTREPTILFASCVR